jgi:hypothetical protein
LFVVDFFGYLASALPGLSPSFFFLSLLGSDCSVQFLVSVLGEHVLSSDSFVDFLGSSVALQFLTPPFCFPWITCFFPFAVLSLCAQDLVGAKSPTRGTAQASSFFFVFAQASRSCLPLLVFSVSLPWQFVQLAPRSGASLSLSVIFGPLRESGLLPPISSRDHSLRQEQCP